MGGKGQLAYLVEEYGASVGLLKVAFAFVEGTCEGTFFVTKEFGIYGALGDGATVHSHVRFVLTQAEGVNDLWEDLLTATALANDEDRELNGGNLHSRVYGPEQLGVVANNAKTRLDFRIIHCTK